MMNFFILALLLLSPLTWGQKQTFEEKIFHDRKEVVKALKEFVQEAEEKHGLKITFDSTNNRWSLISNAWADENYNCFYGGWPSILTTSGGKKYCQQPQKHSGAYDQGTCEKGQLRCQPQLFGSNTCVSFNTPRDRQTAFSSCEVKFRESKDKDYSFTEKFDEQDFERLKEISTLAQQICSVDGNLGIQKTSPMCKKLNDKLEKHLKSLYQGTDVKKVQSTELPPSTNTEVPQALVAEELPVVVNGKSAEVSNSTGDCEICNKSVKNPIEHIEEHSREIKQITNHVEPDSIKAKYIRMKEKFLKSPHCDPTKLFSHGEAFNPLLLNHVKNGKIGIWFSTFNNMSTTKRMDAIAPFFPKGSEDFNEIQKSLEVTNSFERKRHSDAYLHMQATRMLIVKKLAALEKTQPEMFNDVYMEGLEASKIFGLDPENEEKIVCPFPSEDAFRKAYEGYSKIKGGKDVKKKNQLTIVDYTMPSNHRRMFVMDMTSENVLHNTWTAHGIGKTNSGDIARERESKDYEAPVKFSRKSGSWLTREGFMVAGTKRQSSAFGEVINFYGKDLYNSAKPNTLFDNRMTNDAVWMHASGAPAQSYLTNSKEVMSATDLELDPTKPGFNLQKINIASSRLSSSTLGNRLPKTMACLGVTSMPIEQLDWKGRKINQFQALKEDLPGSVVFAYSGPEQKSFYFK